MNELANNAARFFKESFDEEPQHIFLSPGRINIIGEHIDYNNGFVMPGAIDKYVCLAISKRADTKCIIAAGDLEERYEFDINDAIAPVAQTWANYFLGIVLLLRERQLVPAGFQLAFTSTIPIGAGLSSSAAVECGFAYALNELFSFGLDKKEIALMGQRSENDFVGVQCGIMDQFASVFGKAGHVIQLDCDSLEYTYHPADFQDYALLLFNSNVKHTLLTSGYNTRRQETADGLAIIKKALPEIKGFRDVTEIQLAQFREEMGEIIYRRCHFVVKEIKRVLDAADALEKSDFKTLGALMYETHKGLSEEYEVSCAETDFLVNEVRKDERVLGARMMGGGFGGCTINLVEKGAEDKLIKNICAAYKAAFNIEAEPYKISLADGTHRYADYTQP